MREYSDSAGFVRKRVWKNAEGEATRARWQAFVSYKELDTGVYDEEGRQVPSDWQYMSKVLDVKAYPEKGNNRGKNAALKELAEWRAELIADEPERAKEEAARNAPADVLTRYSTVAQYVGYYLAEYLPKKKKVEASTMAGYRRYEREINEGIGTIQRGRKDVPTGLGEVRLCDLTREGIEEWRNNLLTKYAPVTVQGALHLLQRAMRAAVDERIIETSPAEAVEAPVVQQGEAGYLETEERVRLLDDLDRTLRGEFVQSNESKPAALAAKMALLTGMRESEVCGLKWADVDFEGGFIKVRNAIGRTDHGTYEKGTKTSNSRRDSSKRDLSIPPQLEPDLRARRSDMEAEAEAAGIELSPEAYVLGGIDGSYLNPRWLYRCWSRRVKRLNLVTNQGQPAKFHDLRHTYATVMAHSGMPKMTLKEVMGHSSLDTTERYYIGVDSKANKRAMDTYAPLLYGAEPSNVVQLNRTGTEG